MTADFNVDIWSAMCKFLSSPTRRGIFQRKRLLTWKVPTNASEWKLVHQRHWKISFSILVCGAYVRREEEFDSGIKTETDCVLFLLLHGDQMLLLFFAWAAVRKQSSKYVCWTDWKAPAFQTCVLMNFVDLKIYVTGWRRALLCFDVGGDLKIKLVSPPWLLRENTKGEKL